MSRVDFYILQTTAARQRWAVACRLAEKAYLRDLAVVLYSGSPADTQALDELLWTFSDRAFVPHEIRRAGAAAAAPVQLTADLEDVPPADLLVNLSDRLPPALERFARIAEIVDADEECRRLGRERYKVYRDREFAVQTHSLDDGAGA